MSKIIRVAGIDPSLTNTGLAKFDLDVQSGALTLLDIHLIETEKLTTKQVRQNSDDLRRVKQIYSGIAGWLVDCPFFFAEIPTGAQSARAAYAFGMVLGLVGSFATKRDLIQVQPSETKLATVGTKTASKKEMVEWAVEAYPDGAWLKKTTKGVTRYIDKNEHMADACAIVHAGVKTDEFCRTISIWRKSAA